MHMQCWVLLRRNRLSKRDANHSKTALTVLGLEHPSTGALLALCTTEPARLTTPRKWWTIYHMSPGTYLHIPTDTSIYIHIHAYTYIYMHIHAHTRHPPTWKGHISATSEPIDQSQRTDLITAHFRQIVLVFWHMKRIRHDMAAWQKLGKRLNLGAPEHPKYASDFSARGCVLHNAAGRTSDPSLSLPGRSWPILQPWQHGT
jgi:hypothetical protein